MCSHSTTIFHTEKSNKMQQCIKFYYFIFIWSSACFGQHTAHRQEPKITLAASGFAYMEGCWTCGWWTLSGIMCPTTWGYQCIKFYYFIFTWSSTCFERHTAHHQEPKIALEASGFAYVEGCLDVWLPDAVPEDYASAPKDVGII